MSKASPKVDVYTCPQCGRVSDLTPIYEAICSKIKAQALRGAADRCGILAELMEQGAGEDEPGYRLRQAERDIRRMASEDERES
jgi:hypothetical protein